MYDRKISNRVFFLLSVNSVASKLDPLTGWSIKQRRILKGHLGKVLCLDWSMDKRHLVSSSQDGKIIVWDAFTSTKEHLITSQSTWVSKLVNERPNHLVRKLVEFVFS